MPALVTWKIIEIIFENHNVFKINLLASLICGRYRIHKDEADTDYSTLKELTI